MVKRAGGESYTMDTSSVDYIVADATERAALTGMVAKQTCLQLDTNIIYIYSGSSWSLWITCG